MANQYNFCTKDEGGQHILHTECYTEQNHNQSNNCFICYKGDFYLGRHFDTFCLIRDTRLLGFNQNLCIDYQFRNCILIAVKIKYFQIDIFLLALEFPKILSYLIVDSGNKFWQPQLDI